MKTATVFPPSTLPSLHGVYQTRFIDPETDQPSGDWGYSYFDLIDRIWGCQAATRDEAFGNRDFEFALQNKEWCNLDEEPAT